MSATAVLLITGVFLIAIGLPIAFGLGWASVAGLLVKGQTLLVFPQRLWTSIDSFTLMAIIFFVIAGELMLQGGISKRLINLAMVFFRYLRGGLATVSLISCAMFGALSGSALATTAAIGGIMYPEMTSEKGGYGKVFTGTLMAAGGTLGTMRPPSITLILYANITNTSVGDLFLAVIIPGLIMMMMYIVAAYIYIFRRGYDGPALRATREKTSFKQVIKAFYEGIWAILMPVIILGGIYGGIFTPTESAVVACFYAIIVGVFIYRELTLKLFYRAIVKAAVISATIMLLVATANLFGWVMAILNIPAAVMDGLAVFTDTRFVFLLMINVLFLICGMFMDTTVIILLIIPLLFTTASNLGISLIHFGVIACINLSMGMITPPFGTSLFVSANMTGQKIEPMYKEVLLYCLMGCVGILLVTYIPSISMFLIK